jgi:hypothetical protein
MAFRIGHLWSSAVQNDEQITLVILYCRTPQETNPKGHWEPNYFLIQYLFWRWWWSLHGFLGQPQGAHVVPLSRPAWNVLVHEDGDVGLDAPLGFSPLASYLGIAGVSRHRWREDCIAGSLESVAIVGEGICIAGSRLQ